MGKKYLKLIVMGAILAVSIPQAAYAYIDPSTGSYVMQVLLAAVLGVSFVVKSYWNKIKTFFRKGH
ncbi:hypothetical protein Psch_03366 [Pelotomaculum schinkii]|uniref:Uncharacterized protein n=1 Tax=Pelotomaculum schinkii TaxID=78350 RepID=A0A4Y7R6N4_9FIRM|nr:hypothetical protein [Pelotomaculum schinkii]TEB04605.1 hypothetical protein Psch_03366 [Pelotomaculum schinkii]